MRAALSGFEAWIVAICFVATMLIIIPTYGILGNEFLQLTRGYWTGAAIIVGIVGILGGVGRYLPGGRIIVISLSALLAVSTINHLLIFDYVFSGPVDGENMTLANNTSISYLATMIYAALLIGVFCVLKRRLLSSYAVAVVCTMAALVSLSGQQISRQPGNVVADDTAPEKETFRLSPELNIIHLLPDGLQTDLVVKVLQSDKELAKKFNEFTVFTNHVGAFPSTIFTVPTLLSGRFFDVSQPTRERIVEEISERGMFRFLAEAGFEVHLAPITVDHCGRHATTCYPLNFGDMVPRGFYELPATSLYSAALALDLAMLRTLPAAFVPWIFNEGNWRFAGLSAEYGALGQNLAPGLEQMAERFHVVADAPPTYRWHHYIGTHPPYKWDENCDYVAHLRGVDRPGTSFDEAIAQTKCVLRGIAQFMQAIDELGVLDRVIIIVSADHGTSQIPSGVPAVFGSRQVDLRMIGHARPALMIKGRDSRGPLKFSSAATSAIDIAPTVLGLAGLPHELQGIDIVASQQTSGRRREFHVYQDLWVGEKPIPTVVYSVGENSVNPDHWRVDRFSAFEAPPTKFSEFTAGQMRLFQRGASAGDNPEKHGRWIAGTRLTALLHAAEANAIIITGNMPEFNEGATFSVGVDGQNIASGMKFAPDYGQYWASISLCLPQKFEADRARIDLEFSNVVSGQHPTTPLSALIHEIAFTQDENCE